MKHTIFFAILTFSFLVTSIFAQTTDDKVLAQGNPALTQTMIDKSREVFEFTFGGALNESEKQIYQNHLIKQWKGNDTETIKSIQNLVDFYDKVAGLSKEKLIEVQTQLREPLVKDLRNQANTEPLAKMLIGAFDRIQGLNVKQGGNLPAPKEVRQQGGVQPRQRLPLVNLARLNRGWLLFSGHRHAIPAFGGFTLQRGRPEA